MGQYGGVDALNLIIDKCRGNKLLAAKKLNISLASLYNYRSGRTEIPAEKIKEFNNLLMKMHGSEFENDLTPEEFMEELNAIGKPKRIAIDSSRFETIVASLLMKKYGDEKDVLLHPLLKTSSTVYRPDILIRDQVSGAIEEIIEIKNSVVDLAAVAQLLSYAKIVGTIYKDTDPSELKLTIIGTEIAEASQNAISFLNETAKVKIKFTSIDKIFELKI